MTSLAFGLGVLPLVLSTVGFFFVRQWFGGASGAAGDVVEVTSLPIPDWQRIIFGRGRTVNPLFYSALIPMVLSFLAIKFRGLRPAISAMVRPSIPRTRRAVGGSVT